MAKSKSSKLTTKDLKEKLAKLESDINKLVEKTETTTQQPPTPQETSTPQTLENPETTKSRKEILEEYEKDYLVRLEKQKQETEAQRAAEELEAQKASQSTTRGTMPQGWKPS